MTQEEKARAYDEVLNKLRHFITKGVDPLITRADVQDFFPELAESEDEKLRKQLIEWFSLPQKEYVAGFERKKVLAWLEKQGGYANFRNKAQVGDRITKNEDGVLVNLSQLKRVAKPSEKQGEQEKDILEDAILDGNEDGLIAETIRYKNVNIQQKDFAPQEDIPRYSIGDVLCDKSCTTLNKESQPNFEITDIRNGMYICDKCSFPISQQDEYELVAKRIEQKPAWSEEDECYMSECIGAIATKDGWSFDEKRKTKHWLKSLKDRVLSQPKQEWSEEDKYMYDILCGTIENTDINENTKYKLISWLKSIKERKGGKI